MNAGVGPARIVEAPVRVEWDGFEDREVRGRVHAAIARLTDPERVAAPWSISELSGGASNLNCLVAIDGVDHVLRVSDYDVERMGGTRADGWEVQALAAAGGVGAPVLAYCLPEGHCLSRFVPGEALDLRSFRSRSLLGEIARLLRRMHDLAPPAARWSAFADIAHYDRLARAEGLPLPADLDALLAAAARIESVIESVPGAAGFCHNDLQIQNFIDDRAGRLWLIDWEWAGAGNRYFDLGGFVVNAELGPEEEAEFIAAYFAAPAVEVERARIELMRLVSALREALWAVVAEPVLENEWDYRAWAEDYFGRARALVGGGRFEELLALSRPEP